jgi:hypothetical protein
MLAGPLDSPELVILLGFPAPGDSRARFTDCLFPRSSILLVLWASLVAWSQGSDLLFAAQRILAQASFGSRLRLECSRSTWF